MTEQNKIILAGAFSLMAHSLRESRLIDDRWIPKKKREFNPHPTVEDTIILDIFKRIDRYVMADGVRTAEERAEKVKEAIDALPDTQRYVNHIMVSLYLIRIVGDDEGGAFDILLSKPANRAIDAIIEAVNKEAGRDTTINSYRVADNIARYINGKPILDDEIRNAWLKNRLGINTKGE